MATFDYSTPGSKTVDRIVRPNNHIGEAFGGDVVRLDESELKQPCVAAALWTEDEAAEYERRLEEARRAQFAGPASPASRSADLQMRAAVEARRAAAERARTKPAEE